MLGSLLQSYASSSDARQKFELREEIAGKVRALLIEQLERAGLQAADAEDAAVDKVIALLEILLSNPSIANPEGYVRRVARHVLIDFRRHRSSRAYIPPVDVQEASASARLVQESDEQADTNEALIRCLGAILARPEAPKAYVCILEAHYYWEVPLEVITCHELLQRRIAPPWGASDQKKARNSVDQRLTRARKWLQLEAERCCTEALS